MTPLRAPLFAAGALAALLAAAPHPAPAAEVEVREGDVIRMVVQGVAVAIVDPNPAFAQARRIKGIVQDVHGEEAVYSSGGGADPEVVDAIEMGDPLPPGAEPRQVEDRLDARLPDWAADWVAVGEHLIALDARDRVLAVYYDMLP